MSDKLILKEAVVTKADGSIEKVYIENDDVDKKTWKDHLPLIYTSVGIIALSLTVYLSILQIKRTR